MKVCIENFGPVKRFDFDTDNEFHLIVGNNNVGKSYALSAYYAVFKSVMEIGRELTPVNFMGPYFIELMQDKYGKDLDKHFPISNIEKQDANVHDFFVAYLKEVLQNTLAPTFTELIKGSYSEMKSISNRYCKEQVKIGVSVPGFSFSLKGDIEGFTVSDINIEKQAVLRGVKQNRIAVVQGGKLVIYKNIAKDNGEDVYETVAQESYKFLQVGLGRIMSQISDIHYLPASRSGLYQALSAFGQIVAELSKSRSFLSKKIELPGISQQLSDYFIKLSNLSARRQGANDDIEEIAQRVESTVLKGKIEFDSRDKKLYYRPDNTGLRLDLSATSSMVSEVGPIVAYIRHILSRPAQFRASARYSRAMLRRMHRAKQILIIEEPEAHLHPVNQIAMTELYAELSKLGINVIITSHSNYIFNKISNLVIAGNLSVSDVRCDYFQMGDQGSYGIKQEIDDLGIDDNNFIDAAELLFNEKMDLLDSREHDA